MLYQILKTKYSLSLRKKRIHNERFFFIFFSSFFFGFIEWQHMFDLMSVKLSTGLGLLYLGSGEGNTQVIRLAQLVIMQFH